MRLGGSLYLGLPKATDTRIVVPDLPLGDLTALVVAFYDREAVFIDRGDDSDMVDGSIL